MINCKNDCVKSKYIKKNLFSHCKFCIMLYIIAASLFSITMNQHALAQDLSSIKDKASDLLNSQSGSNNTGGSVNNNTSTGDTGTSSLKDKASNAIGSLLK